jgi:hypothetical protein
MRHAGYTPEIKPNTMQASIAIHEYREIYGNREVWHQVYGIYDLQDDE